ncbi:MAG: type II toxin-antitoxin system HicB family antitoxin [Candidatus Nitrosoglobus sp.]|jgi:predicted RNase H-like HicB family nuclease
MQLTAVFQKVPEGYIGFVEELPGANTQGETLEETKANLREAITLVLEANRTLAEEALQHQDVIREPFDLTAL